MSTKQLWIGPDAALAAGDAGFLIERSNAAQGWRRYSLESLPAHTNQSRRPRLYGWCGTTDDVSVQAQGMAQVVRVAGNGRALVEPLAGADLRAALEKLGYPELADG